MRIEEGLERSRVLALFLSKAAFGSDWAALEVGTFRFRDLVRLDDAPARESLGQFSYVDWPKGREEYARLREACLVGRVEAPPPDPEIPVRVLSLGHTATITSVAFSPDGRYALSGSEDHTLRLWEVDSGRAVRVMEGHTDGVSSVTFSPDGRYALSGSEDNTVRLWEVESGRSLEAMEGHTSRVLSVALSPDGRVCTVRCPQWSDARLGPGPLAVSHAREGGV